MMIAGVLILEGNRTYGRCGVENTKNQTKNQKYLYKFLPHDNTLKSILVPYAIKHIGFNKHYKNKYCLVSIDGNGNGDGNGDGDGNELSPGTQDLL